MRPLLIAVLAAALAGAVLGAVVVGRRWLGLRPALQAEAYKVRVVHQTRRAAQIQGAVAFVGDSIIEDMAASTVVPCAENFGIGGDTMAQVGERLSVLGLSQAQAVVLHVGVNDGWGRLGFNAFGERYARMMAEIPPHVPVVASAMLPVDPGRNAALARLAGGLRAANEEMRVACSRRPGCSFVDAGPDLAGGGGSLQPAFSIGDGVHLNADGYRLLANRLRLALPGALTGHGAGCVSTALPGAPPRR